MKVHLNGRLHLGQLMAPIPALLSACPFLFRNSRGDQALVVSLDGETGALEERVNALLSEARPRVQTRVCGSAILVPGIGVDALIKSRARSIELYVVAGDWSGAPGDIASYAPELKPFDSGPPEGFVDAFSDLGALRYFADGLGTNFCVAAIDEAGELERAEIIIAGRFV